MSGVNSDLPPPGWYTRHGDRYESWWNGQVWTEHRRWAAQDPEPAPQPQPTHGATAAPAVPVLPVGWYPHPACPHGEAYWDGEHWTGLRPTPEPVLPVPDAAGATTPATATAAPTRPAPTPTVAVSHLKKLDPELSTDVYAEEQNRNRWVKRRSLKAAFIVGAVTGAFVAATQVTSRSGAASLTATPRSLLAAAIDAAMAFLITFLFWAPVAYLVARRMNRRRIEAQPELADRREPQPEIRGWLILVTVLTVAAAAGGAIYTASRPTPQQEAQRTVPAITSADNACDVFMNTMLTVARERTPVQVGYARLAVIRDRTTTIYPHMSAALSVVLQHPDTATSDEKGAILQACITDGYVTLTEANAWGSGIQSAADAAGPYIFARSRLERPTLGSRET